MELGLHAGCIMHTNMVTDLRIAQEAGYDAIEIWIPKLVRYLEAGYKTEDLKSGLGRLRPAMMDCVLSIEKQDADFRRGLRKEFTRLAEAAQTLGCSTIQVIVLKDLDGMGWAEMKSKLVSCYKELGDIGAGFGVRLGIEPVVFSGFNRVSQALEVIEKAGCGNLGLVVDTWHVWTAGEPWDVIARLDPEMIYSAHISDTNPKQGVNWRDEDRTALPGEGILPLVDGIRAIQRTGYNGVWSVEMLSQWHWEWDPMQLAMELRKRTLELLTEANSVVEH